jgi:ribonuclease J
MGLLTVSDSALIDIEEVDRHLPGEVLVLCTGSQGEPMSALTLLSANENRWLKLTGEDTVIFSSHPIPGNEHAVTKVIDNLMRLGAEVIHSGLSDVHATGHAKAEELKLYHSIAKPDWFVPVHGEYHHLVAHARLAALMGTPEDHIVLAEDGDRLVLDDEGLRPVGRVPSEYVYVHGTVGDIGHGVLRDRRILADDGVVAAIVCVDRAGRRVVSGPEIVTRGWIYEPEAGDLLVELAGRVRASVDKALADGADVAGLERAVRRASGGFVSDTTRRRPMIVPVVLEA